MTRQPDPTSEMVDVVQVDLGFTVECDHETGCITCGDEAVPMRVERIDAMRGLALCAQEDGTKSTVEIELVGEVTAGDALLVHAGVALQRLDPDTTETGAGRLSMEGA